MSGEILILVCILINYGEISGVREFGSSRERRVRGIWNSRNRDVAITRLDVVIRLVSCVYCRNEIAFHFLTPYREIAMLAEASSREIA